MLSVEEKKAIKELQGCVDFWKEQLEKPYISESDTEIAYKEIKHDTILLNLIQKQDTEINKLNNVIDRMAQEYSLEANTDILDICACCNYNNEDCYGDYCKEALINYFTNKVEEDK